MRIFAFIIVAVFVAGCRDVLPVDNSTTQVTGYQIRGSVTDSTGHPIFGVVVRLAYTYVFYDSVSPGPLTVIVPKAGNVQIGIYDIYDDLIRVLYDGYATPGVMERPWNRQDSTGRVVGSGVYYYDASVDDSEFVTFPIVVDSAVTAYTDNAGNFTINDVNFPIGTLVPRFSGTGTFLGNFVIYNRVDLLFSIGSRTGSQRAAVTSGNAAVVKQIL